MHPRSHLANGFWRLDFLINLGSELKWLPVLIFPWIWEPISTPRLQNRVLATRMHPRCHLANGFWRLDFSRNLGSELGGGRAHFDPLGFKMQFWPLGCVLGAIWPMVFGGWIFLEMWGLSFEACRTEADPEGMHDSPSSKYSCLPLCSSVSFQMLSQTLFVFETLFGVSRWGY